MAPRRAAAHRTQQYNTSSQYGSINSINSLQCSSYHASTVRNNVFVWACLSVAVASRSLCGIWFRRPCVTQTHSELCFLLRLQSSASFFVPGNKCWLSVKARRPLYASLPRLCVGVNAPSSPNVSLRRCERHRYCSGWHVLWFRHKHETDDFHVSWKHR